MPALARRLACVLLLLALPVAAQAARLALVIGNDSYANNIPPLKNARNDARLMRDVLQRAGFKVTLAENLNRGALLDAVERFRGEIQKGDEVVFFFAGHGVQIGGNQLLLPVDIAPQSEARVQRDALPLVDVQDALKDARVALLVIDACRDNPFPKVGTRSIGETRGLLPPEPGSGQIVVLSAGRNQKALDTAPGQSGGNSLFTRQLAQTIQTPGLEIRAALRQVRDKVDDEARKANHQQRPSVVDDLRGDFFIFVAPGGSVTINAPQSPAARPALSAEQIEDQTWEDAARADSLAAYEAYIGAYPQGRYVGRARVRIAALRPAPQSQPQQQSQVTPPQPAPQGAQAPAPLVPGAVEEVRIGHVAPLSGGQAHYGKDNERGAIMAIEDLNVRGIVIGGKKIRFRLVSEDDAADPRQALDAANRLVAARVNGVVGHLNSGTSIPASAIYAAAGIPQITPSATNSRLTKQGYSTTFRVIADDDQLGEGMAAYAVGTLGARRVVIVDDRTNHGRGVADTFERVVKARGVTVVARHDVSERAPDFSAVIRSLRTGDADLIFYGGFDTQGVALLRVMAQAGIRTRLAGTDGICTQELPRLAGSGIGEVYCAEGGVSLAKMPGGRDFSTRYRAKFREDIQVYAPYVYDAVMALVTAMQRADSTDPARYLPALSALDYGGVTGRVRFENNGNLKDPSFTVYSFPAGNKTPVN